MGEWVGNFEYCGSRELTVGVWQEGKSILVQTARYLYLLEIGDPSNYFSVNQEGDCGAVLFNETRTRLFVAKAYSVVAFDTNRTMIWEAKALGGEIVGLEYLRDSALLIEVEFELGEPPDMVKISSIDGRVLGTC